MLLGAGGVGWRDGRCGDTSARWQPINNVVSSAAWVSRFRTPAADIHTLSMPSPIAAYRVFVASPGGLEAEREAFRALLNGYNERDAIERGILFIPVGWELTPGGVGRPQQLINKDVERSDFFVMVLSDKWGSTPNVVGQGPFTSGSEEEFHVAYTSYNEGRLQQLVVFYKDVGADRLKNAGAQLTKVLDFRQKLERRGRLLETFDTVRAFENKLERHFARWVREHEQRGRGEPVGVRLTTAANQAVVPGEPSAPVPGPATSVAVTAERLANEGRISRPSELSPATPTI